DFASNKRQMFLAKTLINWYLILNKKPFQASKDAIGLSTPRHQKQTISHKPHSINLSVSA
ncbi:MAG: hypothetical protein WAT27_07890, partial [Chitinophagales bacterium]